MVYLVPQAEAVSVIGCHDDELLADVLEEMAEDLADLDEQFTTSDPEYGPGITFPEAMRELFAGRYSQPSQAFVYAYAFEEVCRYFGEWLSNAQFHRCGWAWVERLDGVLAEGGVPLRLADLVGRLPAAFPDPGGAPSVGHWRADEAAAALPALVKLLPSVGTEERASLDTVRGWLDAAAAAPGSMIVGVWC
jgi:hypothetical protein